MKLNSNWKYAIFIIALILSTVTQAATREDDEDKECKKPKFREFSPAPKAEVAPESTVSFHISRGADPFNVTAEAKGEKMKVKVVDRVNFLVATTTLPASIREGFARIHVTAKAVDGGCIGQDGWLIKIKGAETGAAKPAQETH